MQPAVSLQVYGKTKIYVVGNPSVMKVANTASLEGVHAQRNYLHKFTSVYIKFCACMWEFLIYSVKHYPMFFSLPPRVSDAWKKKSTHGFMQSILTHGGSQGYLKTSFVAKLKAIPTVTWIKKNIHVSM